MGHVPNNLAYYCIPITISFGKTKLDSACPSVNVAHPMYTHSSISLYMGVGRESCVRVFHSSDVQMLWYESFSIVTL